MGTIEGDKETGEKRLEELNQGAATEELVGVMYVTFTISFSLALSYSWFIFSVSEIAKNKAKLSPGAKDALNLVGGDKNVKDLTKM